MQSPGYRPAGCVPYLGRLGSTLPTPPHLHKQRDATSVPTAGLYNIGEYLCESVTTGRLGQDSDSPQSYKAGNLWLHGFSSTSCLAGVLVGCVELNLVKFGYSTQLILITNWTVRWTAAGAGPPGLTWLSEIRRAHNKVTKVKEQFKERHLKKKKKLKKKKNLTSWATISVLTYTRSWSMRRFEWVVFWRVESATLETKQSVCSEQVYKHCTRG